ncbi:hypothetical protein EQG68_13525 [Flavobacterium piscinae]|uniref:Uncharacterized protein n=1 Tax=Flavobacterium piscinae TaxID=2506424 RepID=A0A4Q1KHX7_9FLAO|nr:hypothetical protein [Flavobacterium piscinae]RXR29142.1 hypothetical protein EQG68_13525 [Flavobacterium piscinae]
MIRVLAGSVLVIVTILLVPSVEKALFFLPLIFALSVSLVNTDKFKLNKVLGIIISVVQSYLVFLGLGIVLYFFDEWIQNITNGGSSEVEGVALITLGGYLAALLLFYFYSYLFKEINSKFSFRVISVCNIAVIIVMLVFSKNEYLQFGVEKFPAYLISWCIFMSLAYSLSLNKELFNKKIKSK